MVVTRSAFILVLLLALPGSLLFAQPAARAPDKTPAKQKQVAANASPPVSTAPIAGPGTPGSSHAPYEAGDCKICHQSADPKQVGGVRKPAPELCLECHDEFAAVMKRPHVHAPVRGSCTSCHNPHSAKYRKLLVAEPRELCTGCHAKIKTAVANARVQHGAMNDGKQCLGCHNAHASSVEHLLIQLPFELCVSCHSRDDVADGKGKKLQNIKTWLASNREWHGPVAAKDCSACHQPHGADHFRLLKDDYPPEFYAPYDARNYALCFSCHNEKAYSTPETTTLTGFRDGSRNMHYLHLQQGGRGRTCRACHEVHASQQNHHIRDGVPYGSGGWVLKLNYTKSPTGGSCAKTCHQEKSYSTRATR